MRGNGSGGEGLTPPLPLNKKVEIKYNFFFGKVSMGGGQSEISKIYTPLVRVQKKGTRKYDLMGKVALTQVKQSNL